MSQEDEKIQVARMQSDIAHLTKSFDEFRVDTKDFHRQQSQAIDEMKRQWQEMGGVIKGMVDMQRVLNEHSDWINKHGPFLVAMVEERNDNRKRFWDYIWKFGWMALGIALAIYMIIFSKTKTIELQSSAFSELTNQLKQYENKNQE